MFFSRKFSGLGGQRRLGRHSRFTRGDHSPPPPVFLRCCNKKPGARARLGGAPRGGWGPLGENRGGRTGKRRNKKGWGRTRGVGSGKNKEYTEIVARGTRRGGGDVLWCIQGKGRSRGERVGGRLGGEGGAGAQNKTGDSYTPQKKFFTGDGGPLGGWRGPTLRNVRKPKVRWGGGPFGGGGKKKTEGFGGPDPTRGPKVDFPLPRGGRVFFRRGQKAEVRGGFFSFRRGKGRGGGKKTHPLKNKGASSGGGTRLGCFFFLLVRENLWGGPAVFSGRSNPKKEGGEGGGGPGEAPGGGQEGARPPKTKSDGGGGDFVGKGAGGFF